jgi:hypothetical protein
LGTSRRASEGPRRTHSELCASYLSGCRYSSATTQTSARDGDHPSRSGLGYVLQNLGLRAVIGNPTRIRATARVQTIKVPSVFVQKAPWSHLGGAGSSVPSLQRAARLRSSQGSTPMWRGSIRASVGFDVSTRIPTAIEAHVEKIVTLTPRGLTNPLSRRALRQALDLSSTTATAH